MLSVTSVFCLKILLNAIVVDNYAA